MLKINRQASNMNMNNVISRNGALYCFCEEEILDNKHSKFETYTFHYTDKNGQDTGEMTAPICEVYYKYMTGFGYMLMQSFNYLVVLASFVFRAVILKITDKIHFFSLT